MPRTKRARVAHLSTTTKKASASKKELYQKVRRVSSMKVANMIWQFLPTVELYVFCHAEESGPGSCFVSEFVFFLNFTGEKIIIRNCVDEYSSIYVITAKAMRNKWIKDIRMEWKGSRFFFGKNKVMGVAFGRTPDAEYKDNLCELSKRLKGHVGVLFTNEEKEYVSKWFQQHRFPDYARAGNIATHEVSLPAGPLDSETFNHSMEPYLRQIGLPTELKKGIIHLTTDYSVCKAGDTLTPEKCTILKRFGYTMAEFRSDLICVWTRDGFEDLEEEGVLN